MLSKIKENIMYLGLSLKKEILVLLLINLMLITGITLLIIYSINFLVTLVVITLVFVVNYIYLSRYSTMVKNLNDRRSADFISLLSYFEIFISNNNNVYNSFLHLLPYCDEWMKEKVENLLKEIDLDKSLSPYINFSNNFSYLAIQNVMISIYQMVDQGSNINSLIQFDHTFSILNINLYKERFDKKAKGYELLAGLPLLGIGIITIVLTFSIMTIIGDIANVI